MKTQLRKACPNPPAPPDIEDEKPQVQLIRKGHEICGINLSAVLQSLHVEDIYDVAFDFTDEFSHFLSSSEEEGEIKDDEPAAVVMNEVRVKQEPVEPEAIQEKDGVGGRLMDLNIRQEDPNKVDLVKNSKSQKHSRKHRKKMRKDESDSDESDSERYQKTQKVHKSSKNDSQSDNNSDDSVKFLEDVPKEKKIITGYISSTDSDHSSSHSNYSKEKKHRTHQKQKEHFSDEDRYSKCDTYTYPLPPVKRNEDPYTCPLPPVKRKEDPKDETRAKKDKKKKEDSKTRKLEELLEKQLKKDKDKKVEEERNVKKEKMFKHERSVKEEKSIKEQKSIKEEKGFIKEDPDSREPVLHIHGSYSCETCQVKMTSLQAYHSHMVGKPHQKKLKLLNPHLVVANTITPSATDGKDKYPLPLPGVIRKQMKEEATVQKLLETMKNSKMPFPGLENVIEIHLLTEKKYYCKLCDSPCAPESIVPHLQGYKHRLKLLKFFRPDLAEKYAYKEKHAIDDKICKILHDIQKKRGIGKMSVEMDFRDDSASDSRYYDSQPSTSRDIRDMPSTSRQPDFGELYDRASKPNPNKPGFYCDVCLVNANSEKGWQDHIRGKRHIKNLKKAPGELPSKCSSIPAPHLRPKLLDYIEDQLPYDEPVVGLRFVQETQNPILKMETYHCFLCGSFLNSLEIIGHVTSYKHRMKYLERIDHPTRHLLDGLREDQAELVMQDMCRNEEIEYGRDEPTVHVTKGSSIYR